MTDCNGSPCRSWIITLAHDGVLTIWGWAAIALMMAAVFGLTWLTYSLIDKYVVDLV